MKRPVWFAIIFFILITLTSCVPSNNCMDNGNYNIEYYSGGGFTGFEQGIIINCSGSVYFWNRKLNSPRETADSLILTTDQIQLFNQLLKNPELFSYTHKHTGNYTSYLTIIKENKNTSISFNPENPPDDMPTDVKELISEIKKIKKP